MSSSGLFARWRFVLSGSVLLFALLVRFVVRDLHGYDEKRGTFSNWDGEVTFRPLVYLTPHSEEELADYVRHRYEQDGYASIRAVGTGLSWSPLCHTNDTLVSLDQLDRVLGVDEAAGTVTVEAGAKITDLTKYLTKMNMALPNTGVITAQSVGGALSTGTRGTGLDVPILSMAVLELRMVIGNGTVISCSKDENPDCFAAGRVGLGALGIITSATLQCRKTPPAMKRQKTFLHVDEAMARLPAMIASASEGRVTVSAFPGGNSSHVLVTTWNAVDGPVRSHNALEAIILSALRRLTSLVNQLQPYVPGWFEHLQMWAATKVILAGDQGDTLEWHDSLRLFPVPILPWIDSEIEMHMPSEAGTEVYPEMLALLSHPTAFNSRWNSVLYMRYAAADDIWLSPCYQRKCVSVLLSLSWKRGVFMDVAERVQRDLSERYGAKPHWGKINTMFGNDLGRLYPRWDDFWSLQRELDPKQLFMNDYLRQLRDGG
mmetsp:Transcript_36668/g.105041  ORF Transcript_36668/g.105041 Transcript_36668/m.105041 type:complete len:488 (+) Transcript_36668:94-1557(+)